MFEYISFTVTHTLKVPIYHTYGQIATCKSEWNSGVYHFSKREYGNDPFTFITDFYLSYACCWWNYKGFLNKIQSTIRSRCHIYSNDSVSNIDIVEYIKPYSIALECRCVLYWTNIDLAIYPVQTPLNMNCLSLISSKQTKENPTNRQRRSRATNSYCHVLIGQQQQH